MSESTTGPAQATPVLDVSRAIDTGKWTKHQTLVVALAALVVVLDGFDNQLLGFSIPQISKEFGTDRGAFSWILAAGYVGVAIGTAVGGLLGDRIGRKYALIAAVILFGTTTLAVAAAPDLLVLGVLRALAGVGLGMVFPAVASIVAEYVPLTKRSLSVALTIVCVPVGGLVGGLIAAEILPALGWRALFAIGGAAPLVLAVVIFFALRESLLFLVSRGRESDLNLVHEGLVRLGHHVDPGVKLIARENADVERGSFRELLGPVYRRDSLALWAAFFFSLMGVFAFYSWGPSLFVDSGFDLAFASRSISVYNLGGITLALLAAWAMTRYGSKITLITMAIGAGVTGAWMFAVQPSPGGSTTVLIVQLVLHGGFFAGLQTVLYSLAAQVYPSNIRATGVGSCGSVGRAGAIFASFAGASLLAAGGGVFYLMLAIAGVMVALALLAVKRHTPAIRSVRESQGSRQTPIAH